jgi:hypothetical protein
MGTMHASKTRPLRQSGSCSEILQPLQFRQGYFPETSVGLENEKFSFVMLDVDIYQPSLEVFRFFYPRLTRGGYFFMHDYNSLRVVEGRLTSGA